MTSLALRPFALSFGSLALGGALSLGLAACSSTGDEDPGGSGGTTGGGGALGSGGAVDGGGGAAGTGATSSGGGVGAGGGVGTGGGAACDTETPECRFENGLDHGCARRFALGVNYAWKNFGGDFGGISAWAQPGVSENAAVATELLDMGDSGVAVVRWWMFPDFRGDGVTFDEAGDPSGLSAGAVADIQKALELADAADLELVLTIFSFDNFRPDREEGEGAGAITIRGMTPMVTNATRRAKLIDNVVRPVAQAVSGSPYAHRLLGWDVINEPEWAVSATGSAPAGGDFDPNPELDPVSLADMKALINESLAALEEETPSAQKSVGWAAAKWAWAFEDVTGVDFHQPHIYAWVNDYWPYTQSPTELGYAGKPTVMGEYYLAASPLADSTTATFAEINESWFTNGYAGAWSWQYNENAADIGLVEAFATSKGCQVRY